MPGAYSHGSLPWAQHSASLTTNCITSTSDTSTFDGGLGSTKLTASTPAGQGFPSMMQPVPIIMPELKQRKHSGDLRCASLEACITRHSMSQETLPAKSYVPPVLLSAKTALRQIASLSTTVESDAGGVVSASQCIGLPIATAFRRYVQVEVAGWLSHVSHVKKIASLQHVPFIPEAYKACRFTLSSLSTHGATVRPMLSATRASIENTWLPVKINTLRSVKVATLRPNACHAAKCLPPRWIAPGSV